MKIAFYNIGRGLVKKLEALEVFVKEEGIDIIGLCETDLGRDDPVPVWQGYVSFCERDVDKVRIIVYVREGLPANQHTKVSAMPAVLLRVGQLTISMVYNEFTSQRRRLTDVERRERLREVLREQDNGATQTALVMGDWNVEWTRRSVERSLLETWAGAEGYAQQIQEVTRPVGGSTIDLIFTRGKNIKQCGVMEPGLSDHLAVFCHVAKQRDKPQRKLIIQDKITEEVIDWARANRPVFSETDTLVDLYEGLRGFFGEIRARSQRRKWVLQSNNPPWYTVELQQLKLSVTEARGDERKRLRNHYVAALRRTRRRYEGEKMKRSARGVWQIIRRQSGGQVIELREGDGVLVGRDAAEKLGSYFKEKQERLRKEPDPGRIKQLFRDHLGGNQHWELKPVSYEKTLKLIDNLKPKKSCGRDGISYYLVKQFKFESAPIIHCIINKSVVEGIFLDEWKVWKIVP